MDRFIVKEPRVGAGFPQGNQMMAFHSNGMSSHMIPPENIYFNGGYPPNYANIQQTMNMPQTMDSPHPMGHSMNLQTQHAMGHTQTFTGSPMVPNGHGQLSGIDSRYLAGYSDNNQQYIMTGQQLQRNQPPINSFGNDYQNRSFTGAERNKLNKVQTTPQQVMALGGLVPSRVEEMSKPYTLGGNETPHKKTQQSFQHTFHSSKAEEMSKPYNVSDVRKNLKQNQQSPHYYPASSELTDIEVIRMNVQTDMMTRTDKLKALHKSGPRIFSGPVEKVLKWHKSLQDIGILIIYEIVAKCVSVRPGEKCAKNLVVRDDNGPAIQVVYYEIDFLLPELKPPCTVRVIGKMMPGTSRLQAFNVRPATGDDVATLPRRAAVAAHHVTKLCKDYARQA